MHLRRALASLAIIALPLLADGATAQTRWPDAWMEPQDTAEAVFESDMYAWRLFVALNWPGDPVRREADRSKPFGAPGVTTWETWRSTNPEAPDSVFRFDARDPGPWNDVPMQVAMARSIKSFDLSLTVRRQSARAATRSITRAPIFVGGEVDRNNEVRFNKAAFEFVRASNFYRQDGIRDALRAGNKTVNAPPMTKTIKAQWRKIAEADKPRFHWAEVALENGTKDLFGLVALHITTKDLPNWFWATFEHVDNKKAGRVSEGIDLDGWQLPSVDRFACTPDRVGCEEIPKSIGLEGTKWANYRLRGTQVDYQNSLGEPTLLSNSVLEKGLQKSSCVSCHAKAAAGELAGDTTAPDERDLKPPAADFFKDGEGKQRFIQTDFLWSLAMRPRPANP